MQTFVYNAHDNKSGEKVVAEIEAADQQGAARLLMERGLSPLSITPKLQKSSLGGARNRIPTKQRVIFSRQLSTLINAGLPLVQSLTTVRSQTANKPLKELLGKVISDVEAGNAFADALAKYPKVFDSVYVSLVAAGEASGTLDTSLERLANQQEKDAEIISKIRGAMVYPVIVLVVLFGVVVFMVVTVLPQVKLFYNNLPGAKLPFITIWLLDFAHLITHLWWLIIIILFGGGYLGLRWSQSPGGIMVLDGLKMRMWPVAPLFMKLYMARFARTGSTLIASGVPIIKMLDTTAEAVGNVHIATSIRKSIESVKGGKALSESLRKDPHFLDLVPDMIRIGEQSGSLEGMMGKVADYYEKEVDNQIKSISTIIEPVLMIFVGVVALIVVAAVLLPIYSLVGKNLVH